jgi:hypothetical protein
MLPQLSLKMDSGELRSNRAWSHGAFDQLSRKARTHNAWRDEALPPSLIQPLHCFSSSRFMLF